MNCKVCGNTSAKNTSISFFRFPKENFKCKDWAERCDLSALFEKHGTLRFYKSFRICSDHFDPKDVIFDGRKNRLLHSATPRVTVTATNSKDDTQKDVKNFNNHGLFELQLTQNLCRLCAEENKNLTDIYGWKGRSVDLEGKLKYFPLLINKCDILPLKICHDCVSKVNQFYDFIIKCTKAETKLKIMLNLKDCNTSHQRTKLEAEYHEKIDWDSGMETSLHEAPKIHDSPHSVTCFQENLTKNYYDQVLQKKFISEHNIDYASMRPEMYFPKTNHLNSHIHFIKDLDFNKNITFEHDYSNTASTDQLHLHPITQAALDQNFPRETKSCDICLEDLHDSQALNIHSSTHSAQSDQNRKSLCGLCNKVSFSRAEKQESAFQHMEGSHLCKVCDKKLNRVAFLNKSTFNHPSENSCDFLEDLRPCHIRWESKKKARQKRFLKCDQAKSSLIGKLHQKLSKLKGRNSQSCDAFFTTCHLRLMREKRGAGNAAPQRCNECGKFFRSKASLRQHRSVHSDERLYNCQECGMSFKRKDTLCNHLRIHTGERPFVCKVCGFAFKQRGDCRKHEKNHTEFCEMALKEKSLTAETQTLEAGLNGFHP